MLWWMTMGFAKNVFRLMTPSDSESGEAYASVYERAV
jgi:hypothetical protein